MLSCPNLFTRIVKNGCIHNGKQRFKCLECGRQVEPPISLAGMARAVKATTYVNAKYAEVVR